MQLASLYQAGRITFLRLEADRQGLGSNQPSFSPTCNKKGGTFQALCKWEVHHWPQNLCLAGSSTSWKWEAMRMTRVKAANENIPWMRTLYWTPREEVNAAITWLKCRKIAGLDGFQPKHLKYGREILTQWFTRALNCVLDLETVLQFFKHSITVPVRKGEGRNPFSCSSDCDIPLVSSLETCHAETVAAHLQEWQMLHQFQTAHSKKTSRHIEAIIHTTNQGERINMCAYNLEKASNTVEYGTCILMNAFQHWHQRESQASWYHHPTTCVQANSCVSHPFEFGRYVQFSAVGESGYCQHVPLIPRAGH